MYRFISLRDITELHTAYKKLYKHDLNKKWDKYVQECPDLGGAMKPNMTAKKLLVADFGQLVDVYFHYLNYINSLSEAQRTAVNNAAEKVFTYSSFSTKIANFLLDPENKFEIHNCVYCDTESVSSYIKKGKGFVDLRQNMCWIRANVLWSLCRCTILSLLVVHVMAQR